MVDQLHSVQRSAAPAVSAAGSEAAGGDAASGVAPKALAGDRDRWIPPLVRRWPQWKLRGKATAVAILLGTLPVLTVGGIADYFTSRAGYEQVTDVQEASAVGLSNKVNRFMYERYGDIQVLAKLPIASLPKVREVTTPAEKQAVLNRYREAYGVYRSIAILDLDGNVLVQSTGDPLPNQQAQPYFQAVLKTNAPYISRTVSPNQGSPKSAELYFAAPVIDDESDKPIAIVRTVVPLQELDTLLKTSELRGRQYNLADGTGTIFLASDDAQVGQSIATDFPGVEPWITAKQSASLITKERDSQQEQLLSYVPGITLGGLPSLNWQMLLAVAPDEAFAAKRQLLTTLLLGTGATAVLVGLAAALLTRRAIQPILQTATAVQQLGQGQLDTRVALQGTDEVAQLGQDVNDMASRLQALVQQQQWSARRSQLLSDVILNLRRSLQYDDILRTGVDEIRAFLNADRVVIYRFNEDWVSGTISAESVLPGFVRAEGQQIYDPLGPDDIDRYREGRVWAVENIHNANLTACHCEILERLGVQSNLVAPVMRNGELLALLCAHQCATTRQWQPEEIEFFTQLAAQIGYALDQAYLLAQTDSARQTAEALSIESTQQKDDLQQQILGLLSEVEGAVMGDLTVRADVTAGSIGTVADFFNSIVESLRQIVAQVKQSSVEVSQSIQNNEQQIRTLADQAQQQSQETTRSLTALEQMMQSIQVVANSASQAATFSRSAATTVESGSTAMEQGVQTILQLRDTIGDTSKKVKRLGEASQQVSKVVSLVNQIAMQTNLLAINAGIEAARAGEEGQGFAVVAEEVGELAARSATAIKEIQQIVATIQRETSDVVEAMEQGTTQVVAGSYSVEQAKQSLEALLTTFRQIDQSVQSISAATIDQVATSESITAVMERVALVTGRTSQASLKVSDSLRQTVDVAKQLETSVDMFKVS
jgi:methyl-accepting chemotaxis protein PixJ